MTDPDSETDEQLFREAAIKSLTWRDQGKVIAYLPPAWWWLCSFLLAAVIVVAVFISIATYARKESVYGILRNSAGEMRVRPTQTGIIDTMLVQRNQWVRKGQPLVHISTRVLLPAGSSYQEKRRSALLAEQATLHQQLAGLDDLYALRRAELQTSLDSVTERVAVLRQKLLVETEILTALITADAADIALLETTDTGRKVPSERKSLLVQRQRSAVRTFEGQLAGLEGQAVTLQARMALQGAERKREELILQAQDAQLIRSLADTESQTSHTLVAAISGRVTAVQYEVGALVTPQHPIMTIIGDQTAVYAEAYIASRAIGFVKPGQEVKLLYDAFPHERFGPGYGTIESVSDTLLAPTEIQSVLPIEEPVYRAKVALQNPYIDAFGKRFLLRSGIAFRAEIILEQRTFLQWLIDPIRTKLTPQAAQATTTPAYP